MGFTTPTIFTYQALRLKLFPLHHFVATVLRHAYYPYTNDLRQDRNQDRKHYTQ
jgi:hypothetical protein